MCRSCRRSPGPAALSTAAATRCTPRSHRARNPPSPHWGRWAAARPRAGWVPGVRTERPHPKEHRSPPATLRSPPQQESGAMTIGPTRKKKDWVYYMKKCACALLGSHRSRAAPRRGLWVLRSRVGGWVDGHPCPARGDTHTHKKHAPPVQGDALPVAAPRGEPTPAGRRSAVAGDVVPPRGSVAGASRVVGVPGSQEAAQRARAGRQEGNSWVCSESRKREFLGGQKGKEKKNKIKITM